MEKKFYDSVSQLNKEELAKQSNLATDVSTKQSGEAPLFSFHSPHERRIKFPIFMTDDLRKSGHKYWRQALITFITAKYRFRGATITNYTQVKAAKELGMPRDYFRKGVSVLLSEGLAFIENGNLRMATNAELSTRYKKGRKGKFVRYHKVVEQGLSHKDIIRVVDTLDIQSKVAQQKYIVRKKKNLVQRQLTLKGVKAIKALQRKGDSIIDPSKEAFLLDVIGMEELSKRIGFSKSKTAKLLKELRDKGVITCNQINIKVCEGNAVQHLDGYCYYDSKSNKTFRVYGTNIEFNPNQQFRGISCRIDCVNSSY